MSVTGTFEVNLTPQHEDIPNVGRLLISKTYSGALQGIGTGQMLSKRTPSGSAVYSAIEEFEGELAGKAGAFTLFHVGNMSNSEQSLQIVIVAGSGQGELEGIQGELAITQVDGIHHYQLNYQI